MSKAKKTAKKLPPPRADAAERRDARRELRDRRPWGPKAKAAPPRKATAAERAAVVEENRRLDKPRKKAGKKKAAKAKAKKKPDLPAVTESAVRGACASATRRFRKTQKQADKECKADADDRGAFGSLGGKYSAAVKKSAPHLVGGRVVVKS
jgi:hypothetical protein